MPNRFEIYQKDPQIYDLLISREDYQQVIPKTLSSIRDFQDLDVADIGAGTGRLSRLIAPKVHSLILTDSSESMLKIAAMRLKEAGFTNFQTHVCDFTRIPADDSSLDVVVEGWALCTNALRHSSWQEMLRKSFAEMRRVLRDNGTIILFETLGTGQEFPTPPNDWFENLYSVLENEYEFMHTSIRTDYKFLSLEEKNQLLTFFFDTEMLDAGVKNDKLIYPECTGVWWRNI